MTGGRPPTSSDIPVIRLDVRIRNQGDRYLVARGPFAFELDGVSGFVWRHIDGHRSIADLAGLVADRYRVEAATAGTDVAEALAPLAEHHLLDFVAGTEQGNVPRAGHG